MAVKTAIFDVGNVLFHWNPRALYERLIPDPRALDAFLRDVVTTDWHFQHDAGRNFAETSAELIALHPEHKHLILAWAQNFDDTITGPVEGMLELLRELDEACVPLFAITNFSHEFFPPFRAKHAEIFDRFRDIIVSGEEQLVKPDPAIYHLALSRFGLARGEAIFIDDSLPNVESASANGFIGYHFEGDTAGLRRLLVSRSIL